MLDSLEIKNFRNLKEFRINSLARVNLITGKNNTGKSSILEALAIFASKGDSNVISKILAERGEDLEKTVFNIKVYASLFYFALLGEAILDK